MVGSMSVTLFSPTKTKSGRISSGMVDIRSSFALILDRKLLYISRYSLIDFSIVWSVQSCRHVYLPFLRRAVVENTVDGRVIMATYWAAGVCSQPHRLSFVGVSTQQAFGLFSRPDWSFLQFCNLKDLTSNCSTVL